MRRAVKVVHELERFNGKTSNWTLEQLLIAGGENLEDEESKGSGRGVSVGVHHLKGLFATKKMAFWTVLNQLYVLYLLWLFSGIMTLLQWWWGSGCHWITCSYHR